jgi:hypothetical protein
MVSVVAGCSHCLVIIFLIHGVQITPGIASALWKLRAKFPTHQIKDIGKAVYRSKKNKGFRIKILGSNSGSAPSLAMGSWTSHLTLLTFNFLSIKCGKNSSLTGSLLWASYSSFFMFLFCFLRQGLTRQPRMASNARSSHLSMWSAENRGTHHYT